MANVIVPAVVLAIAWMVVTNRATLESFLLGFVFGLILWVLVRPRDFQIQWKRLPGQFIALIIYASILARDILLSGLDVTRRVLSPALPLNPGIIAVDTQDETNSALIAALSSDVITLTPGELVVEVEGNRIMYVHCLDVEASAQNVDRQQSHRLSLFKRIMGRDA